MKESNEEVRCSIEIGVANERSGREIETCK